MVRQPSDHLADPSSLLLRMGSRLRARRRELGRTLAEVAGPADVSVSYLSAVEKGTNQPSLQVLVRIVHAEAQTRQCMVAVLEEAACDLARHSGRADGLQHVRPEIRTRIRQRRDEHVPGYAADGIEVDVQGRHN